MANRERVYSTLNEISTLQKRERLVKPRQLKLAMCALSDELVSLARQVEANYKDEGIPQFLAPAVSGGYEAAAKAAIAVYMNRDSVEGDEMFQVLSLMHNAFSLARAVDGVNLPNVAYYALALKAKASEVLSGMWGSSDDR